MEFLIANWIPIFGGLLGLAEIIVRLTPSEKDNSIVNIIKKLFDLIPNKSKLGGKHR